MTDATSDTASSRIERDESGQVLHLGGRWSIAAVLPALPDLQKSGNAQSALRIDSSALGEWDSSLPAFLLQLQQRAAESGIALDTEALPERLARLLKLASAVPPVPDNTPETEHGLFAQVGQLAQRVWADFPAATRFTGELGLSLMRLLRGKSQMKLRDLMWQIDNVGPRALPIVSLISFLVGTILAYMGAIQLAQFGAQIYIADLVAIGMVREIGALMTGVILAGRTGAAFAAQIGSMQVNEEIDALHTLGISPIDHLVLPRFLALVLVTPLLTLYAGFVGMVAGLCVAALAFNVGMTEYWFETLTVMNFTHIGVGLLKGSVYGALIAFAGCLRGVQCGRSAQAVGQATTSAVVTSILLITISASLLTIMFQRLGL